MKRQVVGIVVVAVVASLLAADAARRTKTSEHPITPAPVPVRSATPPNVVFIVLDALRADRIDAVRNGEPVMPHLARFGTENVRFTRAYSPSSWTRPAMASIMTSLYVDAHQVNFGPGAHTGPDAPNDMLPKSAETLGQFLKKAGYATSAVQTNANCTRALGFAEGYDRYEELGSVGAKAVTDQALAQLALAKAPFLMYVHYIDPHIPYQPPEAYRERFGFPPALSQEELKTVTNFMDYFWDHVDVYRGVKSQRDFAELSPEAKEAVRTLYDGEARFVDDELARFLSTLRQERPNTIIVICADHGEHFWDHGCLGHGLTLYGEETAVPLFISAPGMAPKTIDTVTNTIGIVPTIASLLHLAPNPKWQGTDIFATEKAQPAFSRSRGSWPICSRSDLGSVVDGSLKLIMGNTSGVTELYDLTADPHEQHNIAADRPADTERLKGLLARHLQSNIQARTAASAQSAPLDAATADQLKALGYMK